MQIVRVSEVYYSFKRVYFVDRILCGNVHINEEDLNHVDLLADITVQTVIVDQDCRVVEMLRDMWI